MFVQVIRGKATDPAGLRKQIDRWQEELAPGAEGMLGSTGGVTGDNQFFTAVRFESADAAERNGSRPEQDAWWSETQSYLTDVSFENSEDIDTWKDGGSDEAGFVQVMSYKVKDRAKTDQLWEEMTSLPDERSDVLGSISIYGDGGQVTDVIYFSSEAEARENEKKQPEGRAAEIMQEWMGQVDGEISFLDLTEPWLFTR